MCFFLGFGLGGIEALFRVLVCSCFGIRTIFRIAVCEQYSFLRDPDF